MSREERQALFSKCVAQVQSAERLTGWFHPAPTVAVKRGNVIEWLLWALFSAKESDVQPEWDEELSEYVRMLEDALGRPLEPGRDDQVRSMRVSMDNVVSTHRPLLWYLVCASTYLKSSSLLISFIPLSVILEGGWRGGCMHILAASLARLPSLLSLSLVFSLSSPLLLASE